MSQNSFQMLEQLKQYKYLYKYLPLEVVSPEQLKAIETILKSSEITLFNDDNPFNNWIILTQILTYNEIYLSRYTYLDDRLECVVNIEYAKTIDDDTLKKYHDIAKQKIHDLSFIKHLSSFDIFKKHVEFSVSEKAKHYYHPATTDNTLPFGIFSLTSDPSNIQMWSTY
jgi:hypothetical protein